MTLELVQGIEVEPELGNPWAQLLSRARIRMSPCSSNSLNLPLLLTLPLPSPRSEFEPPSSDVARLLRGFLLCPPPNERIDPCWRAIGESLLPLFLGDDIELLDPEVLGGVPLLGVPLPRDDWELFRLYGDMLASGPAGSDEGRGEEDGGEVQKGSL